MRLSMDVETIQDVPGLTEEEKTQLFTVMMKARELDAQEENKMRQPYEGMLLKYTNVMKGYQPRWFVLNPDAGYLYYHYMADEIKSHKPRGAVHLGAAVISPSEEDGQTFSVSAVCGEMYKLRATNVKERQFWLNRLRSVSQAHTQCLDNNTLPREHRVPGEGTPTSTRASSHLPYPLTQEQNVASNWTPQLASAGSVRHPLAPTSEAAQTVTLQDAGNITDAFRSVKEMLLKADRSHQVLVKTVEGLPSSGKFVHSCHPDMLILKATSNATLSCLEQCYSILQQQQVAANYPSGIPDGARVEWVDSVKSGKTNLGTPDLKMNKAKRSPSNPDSSSSPDVKSSLDPFGELSDEEDAVVSLEMTEEQKSQIMKIIAELKLGTDLVRISLPSFLLEPRSLLEVFADLFAQPNLLLSVSNHPSPEERMVAFLEWYLCSVQTSKVARKPYNPIIGETFHCSWKISQEGQENELAMLTYLAEQVSHHPPVSAFYVECQEKGVSIEGNLTVKSKFMGMYAIVNLTGDITLKLKERNESYVFTLPTVFVRSLLNEPWIEMGGRVLVTCPETGCNATITYHIKPFYGGKAHKVSAEVKNALGESFCRVTGEWDDVLQFVSNNGTVREVNAGEMKRNSKRVRPIHEQDNLESRCLWENVTAALRNRDHERATENKLKLEEMQRTTEEERKKRNTHYSAKLFHSDEGSWKYKYTNSPKKVLR